MDFEQKQPRLLHCGEKFVGGGFVKELTKSWLWIRVFFSALLIIALAITIAFVQTIIHWIQSSENGMASLIAALLLCPPFGVYLLATVAFDLTPIGWVCVCVASFVWLTVVIVSNLLLIKVVNRAKQKSDITIKHRILMVVFGGILSGCLVCFSKNEDFLPKQEPKSRNANYLDELARQKFMLDEGLISQEDYEAKKKELLK